MPENTFPGGAEGASPDALEALFDALLDDEQPNAAEPRAVARPDALSNAQRRLWLVHQIEPATTVYIIPCHLALRGELDTAALGRALHALWRRHEALRCVFPTREGEPVRRVLPPESGFDYHEHDLAETPEGDWAAHYRRHHAVAMDLARGPLFRVCLYKLGTRDHRLLLDVHHMNGDGASLAVIQDDLFAYYDAFRSGRDPVLGPLGGAYGDYIAAEAARLESDDYRAALARRCEELEGAPTAIDFRFDKPLPARFAHAGDIAVGRVRDIGWLNQAFAQAQERGASPFMVVLAAFGIALRLHSGQDDLLIAVPTSIRHDERFERTVGFFVNTGVARLDLSGDPTLAELLERAKESVRGLMRCPDAPMDQLVRALCPQRSPSRPPLVQAALSFMVYENAALREVAGLKVEPAPVMHEGAMFELSMDMIVHRDEALLGLEYSTGGWERATVESMVAQFEGALRCFAHDPGLRVGELALAPAPVPALLGEPISAAPQLLHEAVADHARRSPEATALVVGGARFTYGELAAAVQRWRAVYGELQLRAGDLLALACRPGFEWTALVLAAFSEGVGVVPLDPQAPAARTEHILRNAGASVLFHDDSVPVPLPEVDSCTKRFRIGSFSAVASCNEPARGTAESVAYVLYTSGSTGEPKGVRVGQGAFARHCRSAAQAYGITSGDRGLVFSPSCFDAAWEQLFVPLAVGAGVLVRDGALWAPDLLCRQLSDAGVTYADLPPQYLREFVAHVSRHPEALPEKLRIVLSGGEAMPASLAAAWRASPLAPVELINVYGPTEGVVTAAFNRLTAQSRIDTYDSIVPLGRAMPGRELLVLDAAGREVGGGAAGELCLAGPCLAEGYHSDPGRTAGAFRHWARTGRGAAWVEPGTPGACRLYRTGDRVRVGPDGLIEFLGRMDRQLKLRGFRIEPAEIEAALVRHPTVAVARVVRWAGGTAGEQLVAYCIPRDNHVPEERGLREWVARTLPEFMVPAAVVVLAEFPLTPSGKIDEAALPAPKPAGRAASRTESSGLPDDLPARVAAAWSAVLDRDDIGPDENFFDLGGHSLLLVRLHARLTEEFGAKIPLVELFANPTVASMAALLQGAAGPGVARTAGRQRGDVAVVGLAGRFPGAADPTELWAHLVAGRECIRFFDDSELAAAGVPAALRGQANYVPAGGFLAGIDQFDPAFFGYTPAEAEVLDPQQRLFLEESWHALEAAGCDPSRYSGDIAVFGGTGMNLYLLGNLADRMRRGTGADAYSLSLANDKDFVTTRVSYKLDLRGPSVNVNTACSTSLVAIHLAAEALLRGECDMALAGGVSVHLPAVGGYLYQPGGIGSPDGHCRAFADDAAGTVGGSGVAVVALKRLERALADGNTIHAVIKGSAINNDGADKVGFTAPSVNRQRDVIRAALDRAGVDASGIQYVEAHGTGTPMGDPIEVQALCAAFAPDRPGRQRCLLGSIKSNVGHLDTAAGVAGFIKAVLALEHGRIPATLFCDRPSTRIGFEETPFRVAQVSEPWPEGVRRRAGVNSFGIGGTNAHVVLEEAPAIVPVPLRQEVWCLPLSARTTTALAAYVEKLARFLEEHPATDAVDLWHTLSEGRRRFAVRVVVFAATAAEAVLALRALRTTDFLVVDKAGRPVVGTGRPQGRLFAGRAAFAGANAFADAWLGGDSRQASDLLPAGPRRLLSLPTYVFDHARYWVVSPDAAEEPVAVTEVTTEKRPVHEWCHAPTWERVSALRRPEMGTDSLLVVHSGSATELAWLAALRGRHVPVCACPAGAGLAEALAGASRSGLRPKRCLHLGALGLEPGGDGDFALRLDALLSDVRALAAQAADGPLELLLLAPQPGGPALEADPAFSHLDATAVVLPHEYGALAVRCVHVDPREAAGAIVLAAGLPPNLAAEVRSLGWWHGQYWTRKYRRIEAPEPAAGAGRLVRGGVYLITGGFGGIGLTLARHLARNCGARLVLTARAVAGEARQAAVRELEAAGAQVRAVALDVADAAALRALVDRVSEEWGQIDGVVHAAGVGGGSLVARTGRAEIDPVLRAKVAGTVALAAALEGRRPGFVLLCSSLTAALGGPGQIAYAAANAWMDASAAARSAKEPGVWRAVQWDSWAEVGMAARALGAAAPGGELVREWTTSPESFWPWGEHRIDGVPTLPGTAYLELFAQAAGGSGVALESVVLLEPLVCSGAGATTLQLRRAGHELALYSIGEFGSRVHARAQVREAPGVPPPVESLAAIRERCPRAMPMTEGHAGGLVAVGPRWRVDVDIRVGSDEAFARFVLPVEAVADLADHALHPALLDYAISFQHATLEGMEALLPWRYEAVRVFAPLPAEVFGHARLRGRSGRSAVFDIDVLDSEGRLLVQVAGYTLLRVDGQPKESSRAAASVGVSAPNPLAMSPAEGVECFMRILDMDEPVVGVCTVPWSRAAVWSAAPRAGAPEEAAVPAGDRRPRPETSIPFRAPAAPAEVAMAAVWEEVLGYAGLGADDDLIDFGADSFTALKASARLKEVVGVELAMDRFFTKPTIANLARDLPVCPGAQQSAWEEGEL